MQILTLPGTIYMNHTVYRLDPVVRNHIIQLNDMMFVTNITVMDLDPKSLRHFEKYVKQINISHIAYKDFLKKF